MKKACELNEKLIFAIGNAPTALIHLYELIRDRESVAEARNRCAGWLCKCGTVQRADPDS